MRLRSILLASCIMATAGSSAWAAAAPAAAADTATSSPRNVDEIVVTAQKREQNLQNVPIVVTVVTAQQLQDAGVKDIKDLTVLTPGLMVTSTSSETSTTARIRGVGTVGDNLGLESSVGVVIDGVYRPRNGVGFGDLGELSRVEVLKGPQGTLFGKNTTAGVINVVTAKPTFKLGVDLEATVTNYDGYGGSAAINVPLVDDKLAVRVFFADRERRGFQSVLTGAGPRTRNDDGNRNFYTIRAQALWEPTSNVEILFIADHTKRQEACCAAVQILEAGTTQNILHALDPINGGVATVVDPFNRVTYSNRDTPQNIEETGFSGQIDWTTPWLGDAKLTSITAYRHWKRTGFTDPDYTSVDILAYDPQRQFSKFNQFSQELRLAGRVGKLDWLIGGFYAAEDLGSNVSLVYGTQFEQYASLLFSGGTNPALVGTILGRAPGTSFVAGQGQNDTYNQRERNLAVFSNNNFHVTDKFEITVGARYTDELKRLTSAYDNTDGGIGCSTALARAAIPSLTGTIGATSGLTCGTFQNPNFNKLTDIQRKTEQKVTGTVKADYRFSSELLGYVSYARGYKAGGFNLDRTVLCAFTINASCTQRFQPNLDTSFKPETVNSYEVGFKSTLLDRKLLFNATGFYQEYQNFQLNTFNGLVFTVVSIPKVTTKGADVDFVWFAADGLTLNGGVTYADTKYGNDIAAALGATGKCTSLPAGSPATAGTPAGCSLLPGSRLSLAPLWSATLGASYSHKLGERFMGRASVDAKYNSEYNTGSDLNPVKLQKAFTVVNARVSIAPVSEVVSLELFAQNLFNQNYIQVAFDATAQSKTYNAFLGSPRVFGATVRAKF
jgi:iron complex outermembrane receptor protein